jgi:hypothetical protein
MGWVTMGDAITLAMYVPTPVKERAADFNPESVFPRESDIVELQFKVTQRLPLGTRPSVRVESIYVRASASNPIGNTALLYVVGKTAHDTAALRALRTHLELVPLPPGSEKAPTPDDAPPTVYGAKFPFPNSTLFRRLNYHALDAWMRQYRFHSVE